MTEKEINELDTMLTVPEMAKILRIGRNAAYELISEKNFPVLKLGPKKIRVPKGELLEWISNHISDYGIG